MLLSATGRSGPTASFPPTLRPVIKQHLTIIIPALNAAASLPATLAALGPGLRVIVVDGGSRDATPAIATAAGALPLRAPRGRGPQLAAGIAAATTPWVLLCHADTRPEAGWQAAVQAHMATAPDRAAYFRFALDSAQPQARRLERLVAWRCRRLALPYGDQCLLIHRRLLDQVGGMRTLRIMEDVDLVRRIGRHRLTLLPVSAVTSAAKWERDGWTCRSARNLVCLGLWFLGVPDRVIASLYG